MSVPSVLLKKVGARAIITLNRPDVMNAINDTLPRELRERVEEAERDDAVKVVILQGAGKGFSGGYDLNLYAETPGPNMGWQESDKQPWDMMKDYQMMMRNTEDFMSLQRMLKPVICRVHGSGAIAGGSDIALCADLVIMSETARIGYPPARVWGCPTTAQWVQRIGPTAAKRMLLTGDTIDGREAYRLGLATAVVPEAQLDDEVDRWARRMETVPANQLAMHKLLVNSAIETTGLRQQQMLSTLFDGFARHSPEGAAFKRMAEQVGWKQAVALRDNPSKSKL